MAYKIGILTVSDSAARGEAEDRSGPLLAGLVRREPRPGLAESVLAGLRMVEARQDRTRFGPAEGMLAGRAAQGEMATRFGPAWTFSATELEQYASCPFQYFLERVLGIEPLEDLDLAVD